MNSPPERPKAFAGCFVAGAVQPIRKREDRMKKRLRQLLGIVFSALLLYSGYRIYEILTEYALGEAASEKVVRQVVTIADEKLPIAAEQTDAPAAATVTPLETPLENPPITVDFDALRAVNPDIVGWLYCADTPINYPVAYSGDNTYYLRRLYNREANRNGTLFVDGRCSPDFFDLNTIIYGHHMRSGAMFACLVEYGSQEYYEAHPVMYLLTPEHNYRLDIFSGYVTESGSQRFFTGPGDREEFAVYLDDIKALSDFDADAAAGAQERIVTLSTCTYEFQEARYILHAFVTEIAGPPKAFG
jgi:sortase B